MLQLGFVFVSMWECKCLVERFGQVHYKIIG